MDRSRRQARREPRRDGLRDGRDGLREARDAAPARSGGAPPAQSRLTLRKTRNRRRPGSVWSRLPRPAAIADACGRAVRRSLPALAAVSALAVLGGAVWGAVRWLRNSPRFAITQIEIQGVHRLDPGALRARLPIHLGDNAFTDLAGAARAVRDEPWVASAEVRRILPHTIVVAIREHVAAAVVDLGEPYLVDAGGRPFKRAALDTGEADGLPMITGLTRDAFTADPGAAAATVADALATLARWRATDRPAIGEIHLEPHGVVTLHSFAPAIAIQLGALGAEGGARMQAFDAAWAGLSDAERARTRAIHVDLSPALGPALGPAARPDHVTVAFAKD